MKVVVGWRRQAYAAQSNISPFLNDKMGLNILINKSL